MEYYEALESIKDTMGGFDSKDNLRIIHVGMTDKVEIEIAERMKRFKNPERYKDKTPVKSFRNTNKINLTGEEKTIGEYLTVRNMQIMGYTNQSKYWNIARKKAQLECKIKHIDFNQELSI